MVDSVEAAVVAVDSAEAVVAAEDGETVGMEDTGMNKDIIVFSTLNSPKRYLKFCDVTCKLFGSRIRVIKV